MGMIVCGLHIIVVQDKQAAIAQGQEARVLELEAMVAHREQYDFDTLIASRFFSSAFVRHGETLRERDDDKNRAHALEAERKAKVLRLGPLFVRFVRWFVVGLRV
jgi:hypothetical protein